MRSFGFVCLMLSAAAFAQADRPGVSPRPKAQTLDFTASEIEAGRQKPVVDFTVIPERPLFKTRIQVRGSFANELHRSVDALR